eukprot:COSAG05_NODE_259_length_12737_cov_42.436145_3_plen_82_part_00
MFFWIMYKINIFMQCAQKYLSGFYVDFRSEGRCSDMTNFVRSEHLLIDRLLTAAAYSYSCRETSQAPSGSALVISRMISKD